jgi:tetratricopeptide (TPR) repeat protein
MDRKEVIYYLNTISNVILFATLFLLPVFFLTNTTDLFIVPKQLLVIFATTLLLVLWGVRIILERKIVVTANPVNLPVIIFGAVLIISSIVSINRFDSLLQSVPTIFAIVLSLVLINTVRNRNTFNLALYAYALGAALSALMTLAYYLKIYFLPFAGLQSQLFNTTGSAIQQLIYLLPVFVLTGVSVVRKFRAGGLKFSRESVSDYGFFVEIVALAGSVIGLLVIAHQVIFLPDKPILLPYAYGLQTAFASISQDAGRFLFALLFGSGYGTFLSDFTRFKLASFNLEQNIWNLSFSFSSSYFLELIATTGVIGALSYLSIIFSVLRTRATKSPLFVALFVTFVLSILLPFSFVNVAGLMILLALFVAQLNVNQNKHVYEVSLTLVTTKSGIPTFEAMVEGERPSARSESPILSVVVAIIIFLVVGYVAYYAFKFVDSDIKFAESLRQAQANNGQRTYELQTQAINGFPYRADYHRIFSQINLALANSIAAGIPQGQQPNQQVQQNILTLLQQSINSGRNAVTLAPLSSLNWQNLSTVYRSLINVGQNADQFAIASMGQAIALDPYNPNLRVQLGGVYYQLQQWDLAQQQFQLAIDLKRDFANAYYNLGHTLESRGDLQNALAYYQTVRQLSADNPDNMKRIEEEIKALEGKIGQQAAAENVQPQTDQTPLAIPSPAANLPEQNPPVRISPPPPGAGTPAPTSAPSPTPGQ